MNFNFLNSKMKLISSWLWIYNLFFQNKYKISVMVSHLEFKKFIEFN
jgi:hypothetical protein